MTFTFTDFDNVINESWFFFIDFGFSHVNLSRFRCSFGGLSFLIFKILQVILIKNYIVRSINDMPFICVRCEQRTIGLCLGWYTSEAETPFGPPPSTPQKGSRLIYRVHVDPFTNHGSLQLTFSNVCILIFFKCWVVLFWNVCLTFFYKYEYLKIVPSLNLKACHQKV